MNLQDLDKEKARYGWMMLTVEDRNLTSPNVHFLDGENKTVRIQRMFQLIVIQVIIYLLNKSTYHYNT